MTTEKQEELLEQARKDGWLDIHGGDTGAYWRGINPETGKVEKLPEKYTRIIMKTIEQQHTDMVSELKAGTEVVVANFTSYRGAVIVNLINAMIHLSKSIDDAKRHIIYNNHKLDEPSIDDDNPNEPYPITGEQADIMHFALGISGEVLELAHPLLVEATRKSGIDMNIDMTNALEERGDIEWYMKLGDGLLGFTREQILEANIAKLAVRYPNGTFSKEHAENRLDKEGEE